MQIEKINSNKLKVILNKVDLEENHIDLNTFMANSLESQELFLDILDIAEEEFNFYVEDSKLIIESVSLSNNIFIFTITKLSDCKSTPSENNVYCFQHFDQFATAFSFIPKIGDISVYTYRHQFYIIMNKKNPFSPIMDEFSSSKLDSYFLENILIEYGTNINLNKIKNLNKNRCNSIFIK